MAFTKAPEYNTHQTQWIPVAPVETVANATLPTWNPVNLYNLYLVKSGEGVSAYSMGPYRIAAAYHDVFRTAYGTGTITFQGYTLSNTSISTGSSTTSNYNYVVANGSLYTFSSSFISSDLNRYSSTYTTVSNKKTGLTEYVIATTRQIAGTEPYGPASNSRIHYWNTNGSFNTTTTLTQRIGPDIVFLDGYLFTHGNPTETYPSRIYNSTIGSPTTWNQSTDFLDAEILGDPVVGLDKHNNHLVAFGPQSIEFFYNAGNELGSPLQRQASYTLPIGTYFHDNFGYCPKVNINGTIFFVGMSSGKPIGIFQLSNFKLEKISTDWLDIEISAQRSGTSLGLTFPPSLSYARYGTREGVEIRLAYPNSFQTYFYDALTKVWCAVSSPYFSVGFPHSEGTIKFSSVNDLTLYTSTHLNYSSLASPDLDNSYELLRDDVTCIWETDYLDFGSQNNKNFYSVELVGSFGNNSINMVATDNSRLGSNAPTSTSVLVGTSQNDGRIHNRPIIFRNVGNFRAPKFKFSITGQNACRIDGIVVKYNMGTR